MEVDTIYTTYNTPANCRDGPRFERGITDCCCCILYILLCVAVVTLAVVYRGGSVAGFEKPFDFDHQPCMAPFNLLYIGGPDNTHTVCVQTCPAQSGKPMPCRTNSKFPSCPRSGTGLTVNSGHHICAPRGVDTSHYASALSAKSAISAVTAGYREILVAATLTAALALILVITTFIFPELMTCLYLLIFELLLAAISACFFLRYFTNNFPFVHRAIPTSP